MIATRAAGSGSLDQLLPGGGKPLEAHDGNTRTQLTAWQSDLGPEIVRPRLSRVFLLRLSWSMTAIPVDSCGFNPYCWLMLCDSQPSTTIIRTNYYPPCDYSPMLRWTPCCWASLVICTYFDPSFEDRIWSKPMPPGSASFI